MCLLLISHKTVPGYPLILAANRDEFFQRPTASLSFWRSAKKGIKILGGRDLQEGGTWLGIRENGRFAAVTNFREMQSGSGCRSRGEVVTDFLEDDGSCEDFLHGLGSGGSRYRGFNMICGDRENIHYFSNRLQTPSKLSQGIHGLSNHFVNTDWPKVRRGKRFLHKALIQGSVSVDKLFAFLQDDLQPLDDELPDTGVGLMWERILSPIFIKSPGYGTRSSAVVLFHDDGLVEFHERSFQENGAFDDAQQQLICADL